MAPANRSTDDCGYDYGETRRSLTVTTGAYPAWARPVGTFTGADDGRTGLRYGGAVPPGGATATAYEPVDADVEPFPPIDDIATEPSGAVRSIRFYVGNCPTFRAGRGSRTADRRAGRARAPRPGAP